MVNVLWVVPVIVLQHAPGDGVGAGVPPLGVGVGVGVGSVRVGVGPVGVPSGNDAVRSGGVGVAVVPVGVGVVWQVSQKLTASETASTLSRGTCAASRPLASATVIAPVLRIEPPSEAITARSRAFCRLAVFMSQITSPSASMKRKLVEKWTPVIAIVQPMPVQTTRACPPPESMSTGPCICTMSTARMKILPLLFV